MNTIKRLFSTLIFLAPSLALGGLATYLLNHTAYGPGTMVLGFFAVAITGLLLGETRRLTAELGECHRRERARFEEERTAANAILADLERRSSDIIAKSNAIVNGTEK